MVIANNITKNYGNKCVISNFSVKIQDGDFISITGESGRGKTTLLNLLGLLEKPTGGKMVIDNIENPNNKETLMLQRFKFGYLFQNYALIENETVENNLKIALAYRKNIRKKEEIAKSLSAVGLEGFEKRKIFTLSGGEQQRVALARIFAKNCSAIFADEPTGNLDKRNRDLVFNLLKNLNEMGKTVVFVTHDMELASMANSEINLRSYNMK